MQLSAGDIVRLQYKYNNYYGKIRKFYFDRSINLHFADIFIGRNPLRLIIQKVSLLKKVR